MQIASLVGLCSVLENNFYFCLVFLTKMWQKWSKVFLKACSAQFLLPCPCVFSSIRLAIWCVLHISFSTFTTFMSLCRTVRVCKWERAKTKRSFLQMYIFEIFPFQIKSNLPIDHWDSLVGTKIPVYRSICYCSIACLAIMTQRCENILWFKNLKKVNM